ncbi:hypothetical protein BDR03DRAFT_975051 [Suillus americanus]|nr:hypothetical protein BDR03DRAFT_975051 [Suillus americanus]
MSVFLLTVSVHLLVQDHRALYLLLSFRTCMVTRWQLLYVPLSSAHLLLSIQQLCKPLKPCLYSGFQHLLMNLLAI